METLRFRQSTSSGGKMSSRGVVVPAKTSTAATFLLVIPVTLVVTAVVRGVTLMLLWNWFVPPTFAGAPKLGFAAALGLALVSVTLTGRWQMRPGPAPKLERSTPSSVPIDVEAATVYADGVAAWFRKWLRESLSNAAMMILIAWLIQFFL